LTKNGIKRADVHEACVRALSGQQLSATGPALISMDDIDSFSSASSVSDHQVNHISRPLPLAEAKVKEFIARILGEPYLERDWGGELSDICTSRVKLREQRIPAAFLLKGSGLKGKLTPKGLGKNADQIRRFSKQGVVLYVVQHVDQIDESVRDQLHDMVIARRAEGNECAVGSVWDGGDCARLFLAHGLIDPGTGQALN
jgi:hypothetical protein